MLTLFAAVAMPVALAATNPLLAPWSGPHGGVPPFDKVTVELIAPALEAAMAEKLAAVERIANDPATPTFENTLAAMERSGRTLDRVRPIYDVWTSTLATPEVQSLERGMEPREIVMRHRMPHFTHVFEGDSSTLSTPPRPTRPSADATLPPVPSCGATGSQRSVLALGIRDSR